MSSQPTSNGSPGNYATTSPSSFSHCHQQTPNGHINSETLVDDSDPSPSLGDKAPPAPSRVAKSGSRDSGDSYGALLKGAPTFPAGIITGEHLQYRRNRFISSDDESITMANAMNDDRASRSDSHQKMYKRIAGQRVFVNRSVELGKIKFFGFDMDYTLAVYKSPQYEELGFRLIIEHLVTIGYPPELKDLPYDHTFPVRGLWFDKYYGNLLKVDAYGNILVAVHGQQFLKQSEVEELYPNKFIQLSEDRIYVLNTLFNLPETVVLSSLIAYMDNMPSSKREKTGIRMGDLYMSYKSIFKDVRDAVDHIHYEGDMKRLTVESISEYVHKDNRLPTMLANMRSAGRKTFLLTNSDYGYTHKVMTYLMDGDWTQYFDFIIVDAGKPSWFAEGTIFRQVDKETGARKIGMHTGPLRPGQVYSGGSCQVFSDLVGIRGKDVMYVGDHIFGDVLRSKKGRGWRTFLIVPELVHELRVWIDRRDLFAQLESLNKELAELFINMDIKSGEQSKEKVINLRKQMLEVTHRMDQSYGMTGSLFRSGSRQTFFASQVERYADIYAGSCCNLIYYPLFYFFRAEPMLMPHEGTVDREHAGPVEMDGVNPFLPRNRTLSSIEPSLDSEGPPVSPPPPQASVAVPATTVTTTRKEPSKPATVTFQLSPKDAVSSAPATPDSNRTLVGKAKTPRQSTFVYEEQSDDDSPKSKQGSSGDEDSRSEGVKKKSKRHLLDDQKRQRFDSENEHDNGPGHVTEHVSEYEDVVVQQTPVVEQLPKKA